MNMFLKKMSSSLVFISFSLLFFLSLLFYGASVNDNFSFASNVKPGDEGCYDRGGECMTFGHTRDYGPCGSNGYIRPNLCNSSTSQYYRCCVPIDESADSACESLGGECQFFHHDGPSGSCIVNGQLGEIVPSKCDGAVSDHYRCCRPLGNEVEPACGSLATEYPYVVNDWPAGDFCSEGQSNPANPNFPFPGGETTWLCMDGGENVSCSATRLKEDRVASDLACEEVLGGQCQWTDSGGSGALGECLVNGNPGCYIFGACREKPHSIKGGEFYLCCTDDEEFCGGGVEYEKWNDVYLNGDCPFSKPSLEEDRLWCSQGPDTTPSHHGDYTKPSVDITLAKDGSPGSEYFIAPDNGVITKAKAYYQQGDEKCGCELVFETDGGVVYEIRHCFLFAGIGQHYDQRTGRPMKKPLTVRKGEVLGRIADYSDSQIIDHAGGCSSGPHFHVKVEGDDVDRCVDCYFVDKLGCNLYNDGSRSHKGQCGRCYRETGPPDCFDPSWGALCEDGCSGCNIDPIQYCCESDRVECCDPWGNCKIVCDCPHSSGSEEKQEEEEDNDCEVFKNFTGVEFKQLGDSVIGVSSNRPSITGNNQADVRIRYIAENRGYKPRSDGGGFKSSARSAYGDMSSAAMDEESLDLHLGSHYRSVVDQRSIFRNQLSDFCTKDDYSNIANDNCDSHINGILKTYSAPGYSKHHTGYAIDLKCGAGGSYQGFKNTECYAWLSADNYCNAKRFGYIPSYPAGAGNQGPDPEEWEYLWVGKEHLLK